MMVSGSITKDGMSKRTVDPCVVCSLRVKTNSDFFYSRCTRVKWVTPKFSRNFTCRKCEVNIGEAVEQ